MTTESDRELLELAAKAVGYGLPGPDDHDEIGRQELDGLWVKFPWGWGWWRPLFSDADALRLAVKLHLCLLFPMQGERFKQCGAGQVGGSLPACMEPHDPDPFAATRRAIVRAAAEIARATHKEGA